MAGTRPPGPDSPPPRVRLSLGRRLVRALFGGYLRAWHQFRVEGYELIPATGPALVLTNHTSLLDVPALMVADVYPDSALVAKASLFKVPIVRQALHAWGAIPVERQGRDTAGVRAILRALRAGRVVALAAEGHRSRTGRLQPVNPVIARLAAGAGVPIIPVGIAGTFRALPPGSMLPRRHPVVLRLGAPFRLERGLDDATAALGIQAAIAALLPPDQQPDAESSA